MVQRVQQKGSIRIVDCCVFRSCLRPYSLVLRSKNWVKRQHGISTARCDSPSHKPRGLCTLRRQGAPCVNPLRNAVSGHQSIALRAGTWHHGLLTVDAGDFVVMAGGRDVADCELARLADAVSITPA